MPGGGFFAPATLLRRNARREVKVSLMVSETDGLGGYVSTAEAARLLGIGQAAVDRRIQRGTLPALKIGPVYLVRLSDLRLAGRQ